jgi:hypothetical protein
MKYLLLNSNLSTIGVFSSPEEAVQYCYENSLNKDFVIIEETNESILAHSLIINDDSFRSALREHMSSLNEDYSEYWLNKIRDGFAIAYAYKYYPEDMKIFD